MIVRDDICAWLLSYAVAVAAAAVFDRVWLCRAVLGCFSTVLGWAGLCCRLARGVDLRRRFPGVTAIDLEHRLLIPGLTDAHLHLVGHCTLCP